MLHSTQHEAWHSISSADACRILETDPGSGLSEAEAHKRLGQFGVNELEKTHHRRAVDIFIAQFNSLIVLLLLAAGGIAFTLGEQFEAASILAVIGINAAIGFLTEWKAERALAALRQQVISTAEVIRDGLSRKIKSVDLAPGDLVAVQAGDKLPADGRFVEAARLQIEESVLTGESVAVSKGIDPLGDKEASLGDRTNMGYMGTIAVAGRGRLIVTATGPRTEIGKIGSLIQETKRPVTPLEQSIARLGRTLVFVVLGICCAVVAVGWLQGIDFLLMLQTGISLAIAAVPEGLPAVVTMTLALGMQQMARRGVIVRHLPAVETLGSVTTICVDKTGTLTKNEIEARVLFAGTLRFDLTDRDTGNLLADKNYEALRQALQIGALCNDAHAVQSGGTRRFLGDPTEAALLAAAEPAGIDIQTLRRDYPRIDEVPFDSRLKRMVTVHRAPDGELIAFMKGSPGTILELCSEYLTEHGIQNLDEGAAQEYLSINRELAGKSLRILGLAWRKLSHSYRPADLEQNFTFAGIIGMLDPLRPAAKSAVQHCRRAGIRPVMLTGDQPPTAEAIAKELGLDRGLAGEELRTVHARELENSSEADLARLATGTGAFSRVTPKHKLQIVSALQGRGEVVAMTGDGVNDAPALKQADIGIAMGKTGSEVAKEAADMIITDDNFDSIVCAVEGGRRIYANIAKFIHYLFSCNLAEILVVFVAIVLGWPLPLTALQILWLNMVTDIFPALALAFEPSAPDLMNRPPRRQDEGFFTAQFFTLIFWQGVVLSAAALFAFTIGLSWYGDTGTGLRHAQTIAFLSLSGAQIVHAFNTRSRRRSALGIRNATNFWIWGAVFISIAIQAASVSMPVFQRMLHTVAPFGKDWLLVATCSLFPLGVVEMVKLLQRRVDSSAPSRFDFGLHH